MPKVDHMDHLLDLLADAPMGELSSRLHRVHKIPADIMIEAFERGLVKGQLEPLNVKDPPLRLFITKHGLALRKISA